ncbi:MAG: putative rane protein [Firmicutes bacterium]|nr:putative rane protein [Bacillota bacterium]
MITKIHSLIKKLGNPQPTANARQLLKDRLLLLFAIASLYTVLSLLHIGCPLKFLSGISCPGCGMTRAVFSVLHLDFASAWYYHPLFMLAPVIVLLYLFDFYLNPKLLKIIWVMIISAFLIIYLIRLFLTKSNVVEIDISSGLMLKLYQLFFGGR